MKQVREGFTAVKTANTSGEEAAKETRKLQAHDPKMLDKVLRWSDQQVLQWYRNTRRKAGIDDKKR
jgi:hypothetical protein